MRAVMSSCGFTSAFAAELEAYLAFKASMGFYGTSRIWYLKRFDAYCSEHNRTVFDRDTVEEWVGVQLQHSGRYGSWLLTSLVFAGGLRRTEPTNPSDLSDP